MPFLTPVPADDLFPRSGQCVIVFEGEPDAPHFKERTLQISVDAGARISECGDQPAIGFFYLEDLPMNDLEKHHPRDALIALLNFVDQLDMNYGPDLGLMDLLNVFIQIGRELAARDAR